MMDGVLEEPLGGGQNELERSICERSEWSKQITSESRPGRHHQLATAPTPKWRQKSRETVKPFREVTLEYTLILPINPLTLSILETNPTKDLGQPSLENYYNSILYV